MNNPGWFCVTLFYAREDESLHEYVFAGYGTPVEIQREAMIRMMEYLQDTLHKWVGVRGVPTTQDGARAIMRLTNPGKFSPGLTTT